MRRHRRTGGEDALQRRQRDLVLLAVAADDVPDRRRAEGLRDVPVVDRFDDIPRIDLRRPRRVHVGNDRRHSHRAVEQGEQRKAGQVDLARLDVVEIADLVDLPVEVAVAIEHALGRTGAAGGEDDRRRIVGLRWRRAESPASSVPRAQLRDRRPTPEPAPADRHVVFRLGKSPAQHASAPPAPAECRRSPPARSRPGSGRDCARPMPGSISTVTTPALNSANTSEMKSMLGGTISTSRMPGRTPIARQSVGQQVAVVFELAERDRLVDRACPPHRARGGMAIAIAVRILPGRLAQPQADVEIDGRVIGSRPPPATKSSTSRATSTSSALGQCLPARHRVDFDRVQLAVAAGQQIDAGQRRADGGGRRRAMSISDSSGVERLGLRAAADVGSPVERVAAPHAQDALADDEQAKVVPFVRQ